MENEPTKIFLQVDPSGIYTDEELAGWNFEKIRANVTWCPRRIADSDIEYVKSDMSSRWISVKEQLPSDENGSVLAWIVCYNDEDFPESFCITANYSGGSWDCHYNDAQYRWEITHWQFLPTKPQIKK